MDVPADRKYSETHEWYKVEGKFVTLGITQFAADELTDITYVELPKVGSTVKPGVIGEIESVKATAELKCAVGGKVSAVNTTLADRPDLVNEDAFGAAWMVKIEATDLSALDDLYDAAAYREKI